MSSQTNLHPDYYRTVSRQPSTGRSRSSSKGTSNRSDKRGGSGGDETERYYRGGRDEERFADTTRYPPEIVEPSTESQAPTLKSAMRSPSPAGAFAADFKLNLSLAQDAMQDPSSDCYSRIVPRDFPEGISCERNGKTCRNVATRRIEDHATRPETLEDGSEGMMKYEISTPSCESVSSFSRPVVCVSAHVGRCSASRRLRLSR
jgi:hypothetical protein